MKKQQLDNNIGYCEIIIFRGGIKFCGSNWIYYLHIKYVCIIVCRCS